MMFPRNTELLITVAVSTGDISNPHHTGPGKHAGVDVLQHRLGHPHVAEGIWTPCSNIDRPPVDENPQFKVLFRGL